MAKEHKAPSGLMTLHEQTKLSKDLERALERQKREKEKSKHAQANLMHSGIAGATAFGIGMLKGKRLRKALEMQAANRPAAEVEAAKKLPTIMGIDPMMLYSGVSFGMSQYLTGDTAKAALAVCDGTLSAWMYQKGLDKGSEPPAAESHSGT